MFAQQNTVLVTTFVLILNTNLQVSADREEDLNKGVGDASITFNAFLNMFKACISTNVPSEKFKIDNVRGFINAGGRTTVGSGPKITSNRRFFANVVVTREFMEMLDNDINAIKANYVKKMRYCDSVVMNQELLNDFYDREVDQNKL